MAEAASFPGWNASKESKKFELKLFFEPAKYIKNQYQLLAPSERQRFNLTFLTKHKDVLLSTLSECFDTKCNFLPNFEGIVSSVTTVSELEHLWDHYCTKRDDINSKMKEIMDLLSDHVKDIYIFTGIDEDSYDIGKIYLKPKRSNIPEIFQQHPSVKNNAKQKEGGASADSSQSQLTVEGNSPISDASENTKKKKKKKKKKRKRKDKKKKVMLKEKRVTGNIPQVDLNDRINMTMDSMEETASGVQSTQNASEDGHGEQFHQQPVQSQEERSQSSNKEAGHNDSTTVSTHLTAQVSQCNPAVQSTQSKQQGSSDGDKDVEHKEHGKNGQPIPSGQSEQERSQNEKQKEHDETDTSQNEHPLQSGQSQEEMSENEKQKESGAAVTPQVKNDEHSPQSGHITVFEVYTPKRLKVTSIKVFVKESSASNDTVQEIPLSKKTVNLSKNSKDCFWESQPYRFHVNIHYVYSYVASTKGYIYGTNVNKEYKLRRLHILPRVRDIFTDCNQPEKYKQDQMEGCWSYVETLSKTIMEIDLKSTIIDLQDNKIIDSFTHAYEEYYSYQKIMTKSLKLLEAIKPYQKVFLLYVLTWCIPPYSIKRYSQFPASLAKGCLDSFRHCKVEDFPSNSKDILLRVCRELCFHAHNHSNMFLMIAYLSTCMDFETIHDIIIEGNVWYGSQQDPGDVGLCFSSLIPGLTKGNKFAVKATLLLFSKISDLQIILETTKTICHVTDIPEDVRVEIKTKSFEFALNRAREKIEKCSSLNEISKIIETIEDKELLESVCDITQKKVMTIISTNRNVCTDDTNIDTLHFLLFESNILRGNNFRCFMEDIAKSDKPQLHQLFLHLLRKMKYFSEGMSKCCLLWFERAFENAKIKFPNSREKRLPECYSALGEILEIKLVQNECEHIHKMENLVESDLNHLDIPKALAVAGQVEAMERGRAKDVFFGHIHTYLEDHSQKLKCSNLSQYLKDKDIPSRVNTDSHCYLVKQILSSLPAFEYTAHEIMSLNDEIVTDILNNADFWTEIINMKGTYSEELKSHETIQNVLGIMDHVMKRMFNNSITLKMAKSMCLLLEREAPNKTVHFMMYVSKTNKGQFQALVADTKSKQESIAKMCSDIEELVTFLERVNGVRLSYGKLAISELSDYSERHNSFLSGLDSLPVCEIEVMQDWKENWHLEEATALYPVLKLNSFTNFVKKQLDEDKVCELDQESSDKDEDNDKTDINVSLKPKEAEEESLSHHDEATVDDSGWSTCSETKYSTDDENDDVESYEIIKSTGEVISPSAEKQGGATLVHAVNVSKFVCLLQNSLFRYSKLLRETIHVHSNEMLEVIDYLFMDCDIDKEIENLEGYVGKARISEIALLLKYICQRKKTASHVSILVQMSQVFGMDISKETTLLAVSVNEMMKMDVPENVPTIAQFWQSTKKFMQMTNKLNDELWDTIHELSQCHGLIDFLNTVRDEDLRNLIDAVEEHSEQFVDESTVSDLIRVKSFLLPLLSKRDSTSVEHLVDELIDAYKHMEKGVPQMLNNCSQNCTSIKALYMNVANRGEVTKQIVSKILQDGKIVFMIEDDRIDSKVQYSKGGRDVNYNFTELNELHSRVLLISNTETSDETQDKKGHFECFINLCDLVTEISELLENLNQLGHFKFEVYHYEILVREGIETCELDGLLEELIATQNTWTSELNNLRNKYYYLNFVHSKQLCVLNNYLSTGDHEDEALSILKFVKPKLTKESIETAQHVSKYKVQENCHKQLENLGSVLHQCLDHVEDIHSAFPDEPGLWKQIKSLDAKVQSNKVYISHIDIKGIESTPVLLSLYANTTGLFPLPNEVLFCDEETTWTEVELLIRRSIFKPTGCQYNLYCIVGAEKLQYDIQFHLVQKLKDLEIQHNDNARLDFLLAVLFRADQYDNFLTSLSNYVHKAPALGIKAMDLCLQKASGACYMITSELPGQGKTEYVYRKASEMSLGIISIPISGPLTKQKLVNILKNGKVRKYQTLHLDIGSVDQPQLLDDFLFELLVLKFAVSGVNCVHLKTNYIAIEIANTLNNSLRDKLSVASCFKRVHIDWNMSNFSVSPEPNSAVQVVCKYLSAIENNTIGSQDVTINMSDNTTMKASCCQKLLAKYLDDGTDMSYSIVNVFLEALADQLRKFSKSHYFRVACLNEILANKKSVSTIRLDTIKALIKISKEFSCRSITTCKASQNQAVNLLTTSEELVTETMVSRVEGMIQWSDSNHLLVIFQSQDSQTVTSLYRDVSAVPTDIKDLLLLQTRQKILPDYSKYTQGELQDILERIVCTSRDKGIKNRLGDLYKSYALTPDNILKMILVILRIRNHLPVVLMGETGCGKTTLITYLAATCGVDLSVFAFHAGITEKEIQTRIENCNFKALNNPANEHWIFLDEINTCDHLGLLKEVICDQACGGKQLSSNLSVLAACNPYRLRDKNQIHTAGLDGKSVTDELSRLVYRVHPLPESVIDYVWDYGMLHEKDEEAYIEKMVQDIKNTMNITEPIVKLLCYSQKFVRVREKNESAVSLRDVHRCRTLIEWFAQFLEDKDKYPLNRKYGPTLFLNRRAVRLALSHCYEVRLSKMEDRIEYWNGVANFFYSSDGRNLMRKVHEEQMDILNRMVLPQGIAKNAALRENLFVLFVCILNKIPVFLVGKPGCSKSLSVQLLKSNLRGADSKDNFLKTLPELYIVSFQGSESSTSDGIMKVFQKAQKYKEHCNKELQNVLPVVLLDEVGLAEISKYNPLKVLHGLLEPSVGQYPEVAVIGISNWALDAAKMNRAIHLSRPDLTTTELNMTAAAIKEGMNTEWTDDISLLSYLADAYYSYQENQPLKHFHGLRDFYALIKYVCEHISSSTCTEEKDKILQIGIQRNFGGYKQHGEDSAYSFVKYLQKHLEIPYTAKGVEELIKNNLHDNRARHLMILTNGDYALDIIANILHTDGRSYQVILGSKFEDDLCEDYSYRILSKIILCMEQGVVLILKDLEGIYGSLYDMLNQNYSFVGQKKNCRIALGAYSNPMCVVHDHFRCIVIADEQKVDFSDAPFLNRFEKQILQFEELLNENEKKLVSVMNSWVTKASKVQELPFREDDAFLGFHKETLPSLLHRLKSDLSGNSEVDLLEKCKSLLLQTCAPDAIMRLSISQLAFDKEDTESIQEEYFTTIPNCMTKCLEIFCNNDLVTNRNKLAIYTKSNANTNLEQIVKSFIPHQIERLNSFKSEKQLNSQLSAFFKSEKPLLILQCSPNLDADHILLTKLSVDNHLSNNNQECGTSKFIVMVMHLNRQEDREKSGWQFDYTNNWHIVTIDRLEETKFPINTHLLGQSIPELLTSEFINFNALVQENLIDSFSCMKYRVGGRSVSSILQSVTSIKSSTYLLDFLRRSVVKILREACHSYSKYNPQNWQVKTASDAEVMFQGIPLVEAWEQHICNTAKKALVHLLWVLESSSSWQCYHDLFENNVVGLQSLWHSLFDKWMSEQKFDINMRLAPESMNVVYPPLMMTFPFSYILIEEFKEVGNLFLFHEDVGEIEFLDMIECHDRSELVSRYQPLIEHRYNAYVGSFEIDNDGLERLENDLHNLFSYSLDLKMNEDIRACIAREYIEKCCTNCMSYNCFVKLTLTVLTWALQRGKVKKILQLASICGVCVQNQILCTLRGFRKKSSVKENDAYIESPDQVLVEALCQEVLPTTNDFSEFDWITKATQIVSFASKINYESTLLHFLRFLIDTYGLFPEPKTDALKLLISLCKSTCAVPMHEDTNDCQEFEELLDAKSTFIQFKDSCKEMAHFFPKEIIQQMKCSYFGRCLDANPDSPRLSDIMQELLAMNMPDTSFTYVGPVIHRILLNIDITCIIEEVLSSNERYDECIIDVYMREVNVNKEHPLICLCLDIVESILSRTKINMNKDQMWLQNYLQQFEAAMQFINDAETYSLKYLVFLSFTRLYLQCFCDGHQLYRRQANFLQRFDATFGQGIDDKFGFNNQMKVYLLKLLHTTSMKNLIYDVSNLEKSMSSLKTIKWPKSEILLGLGFNGLCVGNYYAEANIEISEGNMEKLIEHVSCNPLTLIGTVAVIVEKYYWIPIVRPYTDSEKQFVKKYEPCLRKLQQPLQTLLLGILGIEQLNHKMLNVSSQLTYNEVIQASFILHVASIIVEQSMHMATSESVWMKIMKTIQNGIQCDELFEDTITFNQINIGKVSFAKCTCGHLNIQSKAEITNCVMCGNVDVDSQSIAIQQTKGPDSIVRQFKTLCLHGCAVAGQALGLISNNQAEISNKIIVDCWESVKAKLDLSDKELGFLLHCLLHKISCVDFKQLDIEMKDHLIMSDQRISTFKQEMYTKMCHSESIFVLEEVGEVYEISRSDSIYSSRVSTAPSVQNLLHKIAIVTECTNQYPFLQLIQIEADKLWLLNCLPSLIKWYMVVQRAVYQKISHEDAAIIKISKFIHEIPALKEARKMDFDKFKDSWDKLKHSPLIVNVLGCLPDISLGSKISECVVKNEAHVFYKVMRFLCQIQNDFLIKSACIGLEGNPALHYLCKGSSIIFPHVFLHNCNPDNIITLEWNATILHHCQNSASFGKGKWIQYDFEKIERVMADSLLFGKCYLVLDESFPVTVYNDEMFHWCNHILSDIGKTVSQKPLQVSVRQRIIKSTTEIHGIAEKFLRYIEVVISLLHKTKGNGSEKLGVFAQKWGVSEASIDSSSIQQQIYSDICLCNIVELYELVELEVAKVTVVTLSSTFCKSLDRNIKSEIDIFLSEHITISSFLTAVCRYAIRYLSIESNYIMPDMHMSELICSPSMWPSGVDIDGTLKSGRKLQEIFPTCLLAEHTKTVHDYLSKLLEVYEQEQEAKSRPQLRVFKNRKRRSQFSTI